MKYEGGFNENYTIKFNPKVKYVLLSINTDLTNADIIKEHLLHSFLKRATYIDPEEYGGFKKSFWIGKYQTNQSASQI